MVIPIFILVTFLGAITGIALQILSEILISKRTNNTITRSSSYITKQRILYVALNTAFWITALALGGLTIKTIEFMLISSAAIILSMVDISIRKLPNGTILFLLILGIVFSAIYGFKDIGFRLLGFGFGFLMFFLPSLIGIGSGWGDVKYGAAVGLCLGFYDYLTAVIVMAILLALYTIYLLITKKGNLKTKIPYGPFLSAGFLTVLIINIINNKHFVFSMEQFLRHTN